MTLWLIKWNKSWVNTKTLIDWNRNGIRMMIRLIRLSEGKWIERNRCNRIEEIFNNLRINREYKESYILQNMNSQINREVISRMKDRSRNRWNWINRLINMKWEG